MKKLLVLLALFPFLHATTYHGELVSCKQNEIVLKLQNENVEISLFNIKLKDDEAWNKTCDLLTKADKIRVEIDPSSAVSEPLPVYLFVDDELLQSLLLKDQQAYIQIRNPEYTYEKELEQAQQSTAVMAQPQKKEVKKQHAKNAPVFFLFLFVIWVSFLLDFWYRKKKKKV